MRENMPGRGYAQGVGIPGREGSGQAEWVDRGPKQFYRPPKNTRPYSWTTFDEVSTAGRLGTYVRNVGHDHDGNPRRARGKEGDGTVFRNPAGLMGTARRMYTDALRSYFVNRLELLSERDRLHIDHIMAGRSERDSAEELDIAQPTVHEGRQRALTHLRALLGKTPEDIATDLVWFMKSEGGVSLAARLPARVAALSRRPVL